MEELKSYIEHFNCQEEVIDCIKILKRNAAFIDARGSHAYDLIVDNINTGNELIQQYFREIKILNSIFCEERKLQSKLQEIPAKYRLAYLILVINQNSLDNYDAIIKKGHEANGISDGFVSLDMTNELHADTLKSLFYDNEISNKQSFLYAPFLLHYNKKYFQIASDFLINAANVCQWKVLYNAWKNGMIEVNSVGGENIFRYKNEKTGWLLKSYGKYVVYKSLNEIQHAIVTYYYSKTFTKSKLPYDETLSVGLLNNYLHCQSEQIDVKEIPRAYWIKAYEFVVRYSKKCRLVVNEKSNTILDWLIKKKNVIKPRSAWIKLMTR